MDWYLQPSQSYLQEYSDLREQSNNWKYGLETFTVRYGSMMSFSVVSESTPVLYPYRAKYSYIPTSGVTLRANPEDWSHDSCFNVITNYDSIGFGQSVSVYHSHIVIGAPAYSDNDGMVFFWNYDYTLNTWKKTNSFRGRDTQYLGATVSVYGSFAAVSSPYYNFGSLVRAGTVYIYYYQTQEDGNLGWIGFQNLTSSLPDRYNEFGRSIDIHDKYLIVGEPYASDRASNSGAVYIYYYDTLNGTWTQEARLKAWDGDSEDQFGSSVSIYQSGSRYYALGGSYFHSQEKGAVYLFGRYGNSWNPLQKFMPDELQNKLTNDNFIGDRFGQSISVNNDNIWCSASNRDISGTLFIFRETVSAPSEDVLVNQTPDNNYDFPQSTIIKQYSNLIKYDTNIPNNYYLNRSRLDTQRIDPINFLQNSSQWLRISVYQNSTLDVDKSK